MTTTRAKKPNLYQMIAMERDQIVEALLKEIKKKKPNVNFITDLISIPGNSFDINEPIIHGVKNFLMRACELNRVEVVKALLENPNVDVNIKFQNYYTALTCAFDKKAQETALLLLEHPSLLVNDSNVLHTGQSALMSACEKGLPDVVKVLLKRNDVNVNFITNGRMVDHTLLESSCYNGHTEVVRVLLAEPNIDVNIGTSNNWLPIHWASAKGYLEIVQLLLAHPNIDVNQTNKFGQCALFLASKNNHSEVVDELLKHPNINVNPDSDSHPLDVAFTQNQYDIVLKIVKHPTFNPNVIYKTYSRTSTPLYDACYSGNIEIVKEILKKNVDINLGYQWNAQDSIRTPLQTAISNGHKEIINLLLEYAGVDETNRNLILGSV